MNVCVFCGSSAGFDPAHAAAARELGKLLASNSMRLIYGGGKVGLMGILADTVMENGGEVIGVIPDFLLRREVAHHGITKLEIVDSMHERKKRMADLSHGFIALSGGWGTLEELFEVLTWRQLGLVQQPVAILNVQRFFDPLIHQMKLMAQHGFLNTAYLDHLQIEDSPAKILSYLQRSKAA
jgi:uncharacterized protein (TIGR00730 family)